jgi:Na+-transporting methylmalonyl-CoA/oxaloacetate decarboxylase gamma subunit
MNAFEFVILIVLIVTIGRLIEKRAGRRHHREAPEAEIVAPEASAKIEELEQRVRVLEQIVTDEGYELRRKFRDLAD